MFSKSEGPTLVLEPEIYPKTSVLGFPGSAFDSKPMDWESFVPPERCKTPTFDDASSSLTPPSTPTKRSKTKTPIGGHGYVPSPFRKPSAEPPSPCKSFSGGSVKGSKSSGITAGSIIIGPDELDYMSKKYGVFDSKGYRLDEPDGSLPLLTRARVADARPDFIQEVIASPFYQNFLGKTRAPSIYIRTPEFVNPFDERVQKEVASKWLPGFATIKSSESKPILFEQPIAMAMFLGNGDWHQENLGTVPFEHKGKRGFVSAIVDHGRVFTNRFATAKDFTDTLEFLYKAFGYEKKFGKIDYLEFAKHFEQISKTSFEDFETLIKKRITVLRKELGEDEIKKIRFRVRNCSSDILITYTGYGRRIIKPDPYKSWDDYQKALIDALKARHEMLPEIIKVLKQKHEDRVAFDAFWAKQCAKAAAPEGPVMFERRNPILHKKSVPPLIEEAETETETVPVSLTSTALLADVPGSDAPTVVLPLSWGKRETPDSGLSILASRRTPGPYRLIVETVPVSLTSTALVTDIPGSDAPTVVISAKTASYTSDSFAATLIIEDPKNSLEFSW